MIVLNSEYTRFFLNVDENEQFVPCVEQEFIDAACNHALQKLNTMIDIAFWNAKYPKEIPRKYLGTYNGASYRSIFLDFGQALYIPPPRFILKTDDIDF